MATSVGLSPGDEFQGRSNRWTITVSFLLAAVTLILLSRGHFLTSSYNADGSVESIQATEKESSRRRLLERKKTLSPGAKATVRMAHEMALANAKEKGDYVAKGQGNPFQAEQDLAMKKKEAGQQESNNTDEETALSKLRKEVDWKSADPLTAKTRPKIGKLNLAKPQIEYLGVTVDAARRYFPMDWLKQLIVYLQKMNYNLIHFRLSDDEQVAVRFKSYPELTRDTDVERYSPSEITELVAFARDRGIAMVPELNLPLRAASWAGIPGLIVPCPIFICEDAHYIPLNLEHPELSTILYGVLQEVLTIFDSPPMLHLGGTMSIHDSDACLAEAGVIGAAQYLVEFEDILRSVLKRLSYPEDQVIRFEAMESVDIEEALQDEENPLVRVGGIRHYWMSLPEATESRAKSIVSTDLQLGTDNDDSAKALYMKTTKVMQLPEKLKAIVVGTMFMSPDSWLNRNVLARLLAISMGASLNSEDAKTPWKALTEFDSKYDTNCQQLLGRGNALCQLKGQPVGILVKFVRDLAEANRDWRTSLCSRLTVGSIQRVFQPYKPDQNYAFSVGNYVFWSNFHRPPATHTPKFNKEGAKKQTLALEVEELKHIVGKTGVIFDLANSLASASDLRALMLTYVAPLGLNMLQLRISDDFAFAVKLENNTRLSNSLWAEDNPSQIPKLTELEEVVDAASEWNIEVFPEVSITTSVGGWINGGFLVKCPKIFCKEGSWIPNDIGDSTFLPVVYAVLWELRKTFGGSSPYIHLGSDERVANLNCFEEAGLKENEDPPFATFEAKLKKLLLMLGIQPQHVIRYDNIEQLSYEDRVGDITHYRDSDIPGELPDVREGEPFMMTTNLLSRSIYSIYKDVYRMARNGTPLAVMAEIRSLDKAVWKEQHMGIRLIAFVLGVSTWEGAGRRMLTKEAFITKMLKICKTVQFPDYEDDLKCKAVKTLLQNEKVADGDDDAVEDQPSLYPIATSKFREAMCAKNTRETRVMVMRDEFVLPKSKREELERETE